jgi:urease accessory protein
MRLGPPPELLLVESGGDNLAAQYSRELVDFTIYVVDLAGGARSPARVDPA